MLWRLLLARLCWTVPLIDASLGSPWSYSMYSCPQSAIFVFRLSLAISMHTLLTQKAHPGGLQVNGNCSLHNTPNGNASTSSTYAYCLITRRSYNVYTPCLKKCHFYFLNNCQKHRPILIILARIIVIKLDVND